MQDDHGFCEGNQDIFFFVDGWPGCWGRKEKGTRKVALVGHQGDEV